MSADVLDMERDVPMSMNSPLMGRGMASFAGLTGVRG